MFQYILIIKFQYILIIILKFILYHYKSIFLFLNNTFFGTLFAGIVIAIFSFSMYRYQKRIDIEEDSKKEFHKIIIDIKRQVIPMHLKVNTMERLFKWHGFKEVQKDESDFTEIENMHSIFEDTILKLEDSIAGTNLSEKYRAFIKRDLKMLSISFYSLHRIIHYEDTETENSREIMQVSIENFFLYMSKVNNFNIS